RGAAVEVAFADEQHALLHRPLAAPTVSRAPPGAPTAWLHSFAPPGLRFGKAPEGRKVVVRAGSPWRVSLRRQPHVQVLDEERPLIGDFLDDLRRRLAAAVAPVGLDADQHRRGAPPAILHLRGALEA